MRYLSLDATHVPAGSVASLPAPFVCAMPAELPEGRAAVIFERGSLTLHDNGAAEWSATTGTWYRTQPSGGVSGGLGGASTSQGRWEQSTATRITLSGLGAGAPAQLTRTPLDSYETQITLYCPGISGNTPRTVTLSLERRPLD